MSNRRYLPESYRRASDAVPVAVAERVAAERDAALRELERARYELQRLRVSEAHGAGELERLRLRAARQADELSALRQRAGAPARAGGSERLRALIAEQAEELERLRLRAARQADELAALRDAGGQQADALAELRQSEARREQELESLRATLAEREAELVALRRASLRPAPPDESARIRQLAADLANVRRHQREAIDAGVREARGRLLGEIAAVRDSLERALLMGDAAVPDAWREGALVLRGQIDQLLEREGARLLGAVGEPFDPHHHEAIATAPGRGEPGRVLEVVRPGLLLDERALVRPAQVVVTA
jgi:molecular chaperone GrpE